MNVKDLEFMKRLKGMFRIEADEHLRAFVAGLIEIEQKPTPERYTEIIEIIFRETHSLKGAAGSVGLKEIQSLCQALENIFSAMKKEELGISKNLLDLLHNVADFITGLVTLEEMECPATERGNLKKIMRQMDDVFNIADDYDVPEQAPIEPELSDNMEQAEPIPTEEIIELQPEILIESVPETEPDPDEDILPIPQVEVIASPRLQIEEKTVIAGTVRIPTARLDALLLQAEELTRIKMAVMQRTIELRDIHNTIVLWKTESDREYIANVSRKSDRVVDTRLTVLEGQVSTLLQTLEGDQRSIKRLVDEHLDTMKHVLMLPISILMESFPKLIRDLAREQGKDVELVMYGLEIGIDKRILEELKDPLIHLLRNCVDHGMQKPVERKNLKKSPRGTITINFSTTESQQVEVVISDDGCGINVNDVRQVAIKMGMVSREIANKLDKQEILQFIFNSGISTSPIITDISGRGLGLAIVREKVEKMGGVISVETQHQVGTTFRLRLPLTLATFRGVLVRSNEQLFIFPTLNVVRVLRIRPEDTQTVENRDTLLVDGRVLSLVSLADALKLPVNNSNKRYINNNSADITEYSYVVVLASANKRICLKVDEVLEEQQVMVKGLGKQLKRVHNVAGATVLGNGKVVVVLNVPDVMQSAMQTTTLARTMEEKTENNNKNKHLLVAEDSITSRTLLKSILETAGYIVTTAVDGLDGFTKLRSGNFDLVVSDVDMPRMSGFELTASIRADKKLADIPVILVTALDSQADRERGIDAGANAYIIKSSFDQSNLLSVVQQLI